MKSIHVWMAVAVVLAVAIYATYTVSGRDDPGLWLKDFEELKGELAAGYANLEWTSKHHGLDLSALGRDTEHKLRNTSSRRNARKIIQHFLESFHDPHLRAEKSDPPGEDRSSGDGWTGPPGTASSRDALDAFGYRKGKYDFGVDFPAIDGFEELDSGENPFPAGVLTLAGGRKLGVIRIKYFGEDVYYDAAAETWGEFKKSVEGTCDGECWWAFTLQVRTRLMEWLQARLVDLESAGANAVLVDITGNGGGSEWCEDVAKVFTTKRLLPRGGAFVKHAHWVRQIEHEIGWIEKDLEKEELPPDLQDILHECLADHEQLLEEVRAGCDASELWKMSGAHLDCDRLASDPHGGYEIPEGAAEHVAALSSEQIPFTPSRHPGFVGLYDGPLFVAIDGHTASASEQFATLLQYNDAATILGEKSFGAGCGYTSGGIKLYLKNVQLRVWMSDCVRLRADGENELAGIEPDIAGWDAGDTGKTRAQKLIEALDQLDTW